MPHGLWLVTRSVTLGLYRDTDQTVIGVNALHAKNRQRFTIAHKVAHLLLHSGRDLFIDRNFSVRHRNDTSAEAVDPDEMAANALAAELLMPVSDVGAGCRNGGLRY